MNKLIKVKRGIYIVSGIAFAVLVAGIWRLSIYVRGITIEEVDAILENHLPIGSSISEVIAFLETLQIDSLEVKNFGYRDFSSKIGVGPFDKKDQQLAGRAKGYLPARIINTSRSFFLSECDMDIQFYFDRDGQLIDHQIIELCDGP